MNRSSQSTWTFAGCGPAAAMARLWLVALVLPTCCGCLGEWLRKPSRAECVAGATQRYYDEAVAEAESPYSSGLALEIPDAARPLTVDQPEGGEKWPMTLQEAIHIALQNSDVIRQLRNGVPTAIATRYQPAIAETTIEEELARFDTNLSVNLFWGRQTDLLNSNISPSGELVAPGSIFMQDTFNGGLGTGLQNSGQVFSLRKQFATGGTFNLAFDTQYSLPNLGTRFFRSSFDSRLSFSFQQPLLGGAGQRVNRARIVIARLRSDQSLWEFRQAVDQLIRDVEQKYWELVAAQVQYAAAQSAVELTSEVVRQLELQLRSTANASDLYEAEQQLHRSRRALTQALEADVVAGSRVPGLLTVERQLRGLLGLRPADGKRIVAVDDPTVAPVEFDWDDLRVETFTYNPDLQAQKMAVAQRREALLLARNGLLPRVDLFVRKDFTGLGDQLDDSIGRITDGSFGDFTIGVQGLVPLGYRREAAIVTRSQEELNQEKALLVSKGHEVLSALARDFAQVHALAATYRAAVDGRMAAERRLAVQRELFDKGDLPINRLLEAIQARAEALNNEVQDMVAYQSALADLEMTKGTITHYNNVHVH